MKQQENHRSIKLGALEISRENCTISTGDSETKVSPRSMDVLLYLIEHNERVISAEELLDRFWSSLASDHAVHKAIAELRAAMGDSVRHQHHIKTVPKRGYKLLIQALDGQPAQKLAPSAAVQLRQRLALMSWRQVVVCTPFILVLAGLGMFAEMRRGTDSSALVLDMAPLCFDSIDADGKGYMLIVSLVQTGEGPLEYPGRFSLRRGDVLNAQDVMACDISGVLAARLDATGG